MFQGAGRLWQQRDQLSFLPQGFTSDFVYSPALQDVDAKCTIFVILACVVAASGGLLFGYDG